MTRLFRLRPLVKPALETAGLDKSVGVMSTQYLKDPTDPGWADDAGMKEFQAWRAKYAPESDPANPVWVYGYTMAQALMIGLKQRATTCRERIS